MITRIHLRIGVFAVVAATATFAADKPAKDKNAAKPQTPIAAALAAPVVPPATVLDETRRFAEARVVRLPKVKTAEEWDKFARQLRRETIEKMILRGEAARWNDAATKVEWLDTVPSTAPADKNAGYTIRKLRFESLPGLWIPALLYVPDKLEGKVPVSLAVNGHEPKGKAVDYKQMRCINMAKRGIIVLNVEWYGMGQLQDDSFTHYRANQLDLCGASAVAPFYLSMKRSLDILLSQPHADPARVAVSGLSGGGWQTIFISSLDERVTLADAVAGYSSFLTRARYPSDLGDTEQTPCDLATVVDYLHLTAMRAPRPTLLTYNSKDDCCFRADHALQPLLDGAQPFFALYGKSDNLRWHINDDPGTHNFQKDNREALYKMLGDFFFAGQPFDWHETAGENEVKTAEQLFVPLPENNENFNTLARKLMASLPVRAQGASDADAGRDTLRRIVRFMPYGNIKAENVTSEKKDDVGIATVRLHFGDDWTIACNEFVRGMPKQTTLLIADAGRKSTAEHVRRLLDKGQRVVTIDPFYFGESAVPERANLYALLIAGVGERPLGIQAGQIAATAGWLLGETGKPVNLMAIGPRTSTIALVAAALEPDAISSVELHDPLPSLKQIIEKNYTVDVMPELFCQGLLVNFDVKDIASLVAPRPVAGL